MSLEQKWLIAMWSKVYQKYCVPHEGDVPMWLLSIPDTGGLLPIDEYFLNELPAGGETNGADAVRHLAGNANFAYSANFIPHFTGPQSLYATVWDVCESVFGQPGERQAKFGLPPDLVGKPQGGEIERQRKVLLNSLMAPDSKEYRETLLSVPLSLFDADTPWSKVSVLGSEVGKVLEGAPGFLKRMIGWDEADSHLCPLDRVNSVSFEINTATIIRPWLDLSQLVRPLWDWILEGTPLLSDGGNPPQGDLPAIPERIIFARNAEVTLKSGTTAAQAEPIVKNLRFLPFMLARVNRSRPAAQRSAQSITSDPVIIRPWLLSAQQRLDLTTPLATKLSEGVSLTSSTSEKTAFRPIVLGHTPLRKDVVPSVAMNLAKPVVASSAHPQITPRKVIYSATGPKLPRVHQEQPPTKWSAISQASVFREVQILAFLCRPLPRLPNPLPDLVFDS